jgi:MoxR-like ATPase
MASFEDQLAAFQTDYRAIIGQIKTVIVGLDDVVEQVLTCLFSGGHVLLEGVPGLGKTLLVRTLASTLDLSFGRIQFTPDLMPSDIIGTNVLQVDESGSRSLVFQPGPIFGHVILADEINRATPKTQSAVLEAMQEGTVTVARHMHVLPEPFFVLATQNPIEMEGTYPLPEAQLDRFMFKALLKGPDVKGIVEILDRTTGPSQPQAAKVGSAKRILEMQQAVRQVIAAEPAKELAARIVAATQPGGASSPAGVRKFVRYGSSPRGAQAMLLAAKVAALRDGRAHVAREDIAQSALPALRHRLILTFEAQAEGVSVEEMIEHVLAVIWDRKN